MKKSIISLVAPLLLSAGLILSGCNTASDRNRRADERARDAQGDIRETERGRAASAEEWRTFKSDAEIQLKENETRIAEMRANMKRPGTAADSLRYNRIITLEQRNADLRNRLNNYENDRSDWETFQRNFNREMDEIENSFENVATTNPRNNPR
jgi:hypothetical protein